MGRWRGLGRIGLRWFDEATNKLFAINEQFHMRLLAIANNRWRDQMVADLRKVMKLNRHNSLIKTGRIAESLAEHQATMDALFANPGFCDGRDDQIWMKRTTA